MVTSTAVVVVKVTDNGNSGYADSELVSLVLKRYTVGEMPHEKIFTLQGEVRTRSIEVVANSSFNTIIRTIGRSIVSHHW